MTFRDYLRLVENARGVVDMREPGANHFNVVLGKRRTILCTTYFWAENVRAKWDRLKDEPLVSHYGSPLVVTVYGPDAETVRIPSRLYNDGRRNAYSADVTIIVRALLDRRIIRPESEIEIGDDALNREPIGLAKDVANGVTEDAPLVLYHGTTVGRAAEILKTGLLPSGETGSRQWREKRSPEWRETSVYLTASYQQAAIYATRATTNARTRKERGQKPAILKIVVPPEARGMFHADDDYLVSLKKNDATADRSWQASLGRYGQVGFSGRIPPEWISPTNIGVKARTAFAPSSYHSQ